MIGRGVLIRLSFAGSVGAYSTTQPWRVDPLTPRGFIYYIFSPSWVGVKGLVLRHYTYLFDFTNQIAKSDRKMCSHYELIQSIGNVKCLEHGGSMGEQLCTGERFQLFRQDFTRHVHNMHVGNLLQFELSLHD